MKRVSFNDGWAFRPKVRAFLESTASGGPWVDVLLPHDAMLGLQRDPAAGPANGYFPGGVWEYKKTFHAPATERDGCVLLELEGVHRDPVVTVNGERVAHRPSGSTQLVVDLTALLRAGEENEVVVEASAGSDARWYTGAGIYRDTWLVVGGAVRVPLNGVRTTTCSADGDVAVVEVTTTVENASAAYASPTLVTELRDATGLVVAADRQPVTIAPRSTSLAVQRMVVRNPERWSTDSPYLYTCRTALMEDAQESDVAVTSFGIRTLTVDPVRGLRLNDKPVLLRGACVHHDNGVIGAATISRADERRVEMLKGAGFNALRSAHQPMSRAMLDACDRVGMLVMDEAFDMWQRAKSDQDGARSFDEWWEEDLAAMVAKDVNHPSVIMYSIGNEIPEIGTATGRVLSRRLADTLRRLDPARLVTAGVNAMLTCQAEILAAVGAGAATDVAEETGINTQLAGLRDQMSALMQMDIVTERTAEAFAALDVAGYNYAQSRYRMDGDLFPNRVVVGSETMPVDIDTNWKDVRELPYLIGDFTWTGWDYLGEAGIGRIAYNADEEASGEFLPGILGAYPWLTAWTGDIDITGHRRPASFYREIVFGLRRDPYITVEPPVRHGTAPSHSSPWSWPELAPSWTWPDSVGAAVKVVVYSDADEVELQLDGQSLGRQAAGQAARYQAAFDITYAPGELVAVAFTRGVESGRATVRSVTGQTRLDVSCDRTVIRADDTDLAFVAIHLVDAHGTVQPTDDQEVKVSVEGPAVLQGMGSADPRTQERFDGASCRLFQGRALAVVRPTGVGSVRVTVTTAAGQADSCVIVAEAPVVGSAS